MTVETSVPRSRRSLLAAAAGGVGALVVAALGRPSSTRAAAGDNLIIGAANDAGASQTILLSSALGATFTLKDTAPGATGIFGWSSAASGAGRALYGRTDSPNGYGLQATNSAANGSGAAIQGLGGNNHGVLGITGHPSAAGVRGFHAGTLENVGYGVAGYASGNGIGVVGKTDSGIGVDGQSGSGFGVRGSSGSNVGVMGTSSSNRGVMGTSNLGIGVYGSSSGSYAVWSNGRLGVTQYIDVTEMVTPPNPAATAARLFVRDVAGKTQLCVLFGTGAVQVIATQV